MLRERDACVMALTAHRDSNVLRLTEARESRQATSDTGPLTARPGESFDDYIERIVATAGAPSPKALAQLPYQLPPIEIADTEATQQAA